RRDPRRESQHHRLSLPHSHRNPSPPPPAQKGGPPCPSQPRLIQLRPIQQSNSATTSPIASIPSAALSPHTNRAIPAKSFCTPCAPAEPAPSPCDSAC